MKCKKSIACILSFALLGSCMFCTAENDGFGLFKYEQVSAAGLVPYALTVQLNNNQFNLNPGDTITINDLEEHGLIINEIVGTYHDMQPDPLYGQLTKTNSVQMLSADDCVIEIPEILEKGENIVKISYCPKNISSSFTVSETLSIYVDFSGTKDPAVTSAVTSEGEPAVTTVTEPDINPGSSTAPVTKIPDEPPIERETYGNVTFDLTDSVAQPGETTYLDINIGENTGFCTLLLYLKFDENVFSIRSISTTSDFTGDEYQLLYNVTNKNILFMNNCTTDIRTPDTNVIRVALDVKENAPEGDYTIEIAEDKKVGGVVGHVPAEGEDPRYSIGYIGTTLLPGKVTVSRSLAPKTNVSSMSLSRVYAAIEGEDTLQCKVGDTTGDGKINALDTIQMIRYFTGTKESISNADIDENGKINISDLILLKNYITLG